MHAAAAGPQAELEHGVPRHRLCLAVVFGSRLDSSVRTLVATQQKKKRTPNTLVDWTGLRLIASSKTDMHNAE